MISAIWSKIATPIALLALIGCVVLGASAWLISSRNADLKSDLSSLRSQLNVCHARQKDVLEHKERSNEIDALSPDDLRKRGAEWLRDE